MFSLMIKEILPIKLKDKEYKDPERKSIYPSKKSTKNKKDNNCK